ncbi:hypothetical protein HY642_00705 [Candidatus Woesearchaeota archaeon]|nr:hypothetical protein [Candidatus Woesearchaeota archaeon]
MEARCVQHKRDFEGDCMWCGKKLCQFCIARTEGKKLYCGACATGLSRFPRQSVPKAGNRAVAEEKKQRLIVKDGYVEFVEA